MLKSLIRPLHGLKHSVVGYFHDWYYAYDDPRTRINYVVTLKNDFQRRSHGEICSSMRQLLSVLSDDFAQIVRANADRELTVCGVPRSKAEHSYDRWQTGLKRTIRQAALQNLDLADGMDFIVRETTTRTTHLGRSGHGGDGELPRPGLLRDTCRLSPDIRGRDILLVDDIYTQGVGIDEDALQALLDAGARSVIFYAVGCTYKHGVTNPSDFEVVPCQNERIPEK